MKLKIILVSIPLLLLGSFLSFPKQSQAVPVLTFGGFVTTITFCPDQASLLIIVSPPFPGSYMFTPTSFPFLYGPPVRVGQALLGVASPTPIPCTAGGAPLGAGLPVIYYGTSNPVKPL
jgi:hypothetical protein